MDHILPSSHNFWLNLGFKAPWQSKHTGIDDSPSARRISPPESGPSTGEYYAYVEFKREVYYLTWSGSAQFPDLDEFPQGLNVRKVDLGREVARTWARSELLGHGRDSCIRQDAGSLPVLKLAHPNLTPRARLKRDFDMLQMMSDSASSLPIPRFHHDPLVDSQGLYGYRMELLHAIDFGKVHQYYQAVKDALQRLHDAGFVMGDLHPGNTIVNEKGDLIFIDLAYAGKLGTAIPSYIPREFFASDVFHDKLDKERLAYFFTETGQSP